MRRYTPVAIAPCGLQAWISVYRLARPVGLAQVLKSLEWLAEQLGLPGGPDRWDRLAQQLDKE